MNIAQVAERSGLTPRMIRHYETLGLVPEPVRTGGNYRDYSERDLERLLLIASSRGAGFGMDEIREIVKLWSDGPAGDASSTVENWLEIVAARQRALDSMREMLRQLIG